MLLGNIVTKTNKVVSVCEVRKPAQRGSLETDPAFESVQKYEEEENKNRNVLFICAHSKIIYDFSESSLGAMFTSETRLTFIINIIVM